MSEDHKQHRHILTSQKQQKDQKHYVKKNDLHTSSPRTLCQKMSNYMEYIPNFRFEQLAVISVTSCGQ